MSSNIKARALVGGTVPADCSRISLRRATIRENLEIAGGAWILSVDRDFAFVPGQVLGLTVDPELPARLYSICSAMNNPQARILYSVAPQGKLTPRLASLKPGDPIYISSPQGNFRAREGRGFWLAAGTGIAPFVAMAESGLAAGKTLVHGARKPDGFYFSALFSQLPGLTYVRCCSQSAPAGVWNGRLTHWLSCQETLDPSASYLLCGSAEMVVNTRDMLISKGIPFEQIEAEIYF